jgi:two-component system phosphate regulon sensor histidine kinase PhoR
VANVSHEVKTPVSAIRAAVETLLDAAETDGEPMNAADAERFHRVIARQASRLDAIVEDLLSLARIEASEQPGGVVLTDAAVLPVLQEALETCSGNAEQRSIHVSVLCDPQLHARMLPRLVGQAMVNLIDNAIKYSPEGSVVRVEAERGGEVIELRVIDAGCGIDPGHLPRVFERFYRIDAARSRRLGGTGLGLSIVKHIAEVNGGSVRAESKPGIGSVFTLVLRACQAGVEAGEVDERKAEHRSFDTTDPAEVRAAEHAGRSTESH